MFNFLAFTYAGLAARNPGPFLAFAVIFFSLLLGPLFFKVAFDPDPYAQYKTPEYKAGIEKRARQDLQARAQVYEYCTQNKIAPWVYVWTMVDGEKHNMMCTMGMPLRK